MRIQVSKGHVNDMCDPSCENKWHVWAQIRPDMKAVYLVTYSWKEAIATAFSRIV